MREGEQRLRDVMTTPGVRLERAAGEWMTSGRRARGRQPYAETVRESLSGLPTEFPPGERRDSTVYAEGSATPIGSGGY
jgi:hypothetical protein